LGKRVTPEGQIYGQNSKFWQFWGVFLISTPMNVKFGMRGPPPCQISRLSGQRVALRGKNPIFGPLSKNNTGMAAIRTGLPLMIDSAPSPYSRNVCMCSLS